MSKLVDRLREVEQTLPDYLAEQELTQLELEYEFRWRIAWKTYLKKHLTDDRLTQYFQKYQRKFDGTTMKVAHLLLPRSDSDESGLQNAGLSPRKSSSRACVRSTRSSSTCHRLLTNKTRQTKRHEVQR